MGSQRIVYDRTLDGTRVLARCITNNDGEQSFRIEGTLNGESVRTMQLDSLPSTRVKQLARRMFQELLNEHRVI